VAAPGTSAFGFAAWSSSRTTGRDERQRFMVRAATGLYAIAALSTALVALPAVVMTPCV
jgi:hypothetical protein